MTAGFSPVCVLPSHTVAAVRLDIVIPAGLAEQERPLQALFTCRCLREGTASLSAAALAERLDWLGAWLDLSVSVHHSFVTLYTLRRFVPETFRLVSDMLRHPTFPAERVDVVRANSRSQHLVNCQRGDVVAQRRLGTAVYGPDHPCGRFAEVHDYDTLTRDDLVRFHRAHYHPSSFAVFLSGDVDDEVLRLTEELFGDSRSTGVQEGNRSSGVQEVIRSSGVQEVIRSTGVQEVIRSTGVQEYRSSDDSRSTGVQEFRSSDDSDANENLHTRVLSELPATPELLNSPNPNPSPLTPNPNSNPSPLTPNPIIILPTAVQASVRMGALLMDVASDDYYPFRIVTTLLGGYFGSRLMQVVREERGLTYGITADLYTNTRQVFFVVSSETDATQGEEVVREVIRQCERLRDEPVGQEELTRVCNYMRGELLRNYEGVYARIDAHIFAHTLGLTADHLERTFAALQTTTPAALQAVARRWLHPDRLTTVIVAPPTR